MVSFAVLGGHAVDCNSFSIAFCSCLPLVRACWCWTWWLRTLLSAGATAACADQEVLRLTALLPLPCAQPAAAEYYSQRAFKGSFQLTEGTVISPHGHGWVRVLLTWR